MRQLLLLLVGVAFARAAVVPSQERYFAAGREYVYHYEGQVVSGIPGVSKEVAGIKITTDVRIQMMADNKCLLRFEQVQLAKIQTETEDPAKQLTVDKLQRLQQEIETPLLEQLVKPIEFRYFNGKVFHIVISQNEPVWASNIKKGVLELMLVNIQGTDDLNEPETQRTQPSNILHQKEHYRVMERGIAGYCESVYNVKISDLVPDIIDKEVQPKRFVLNITKTRDLLECQQRTQRSKLSLLSSRRCEKCKGQETSPAPEPFSEFRKPNEKKEELLKCLSQVRYSISLKDHNKFVIDAVVAEGKHIFQPFGQKGGKAVAFVNQTFILKSTREIQDEFIPDVENPKDQAEDLTFVFEAWKKHEHDSEEERELTEEDGTHMRQIRTKVKTYLQKIQDNIKKDRITEEAPKNFILLVKKLKKFSPLELQNIFDRLGKKFVSDSKEVKERKQILLDALIQVENDKSVEILTSEIGKRSVEGEEACQILSTIALINEPTEEILDHVLGQCRGPVVNGPNADQQVRKTCWLSFGSLVHKACKVNQICSEDKKQEYSMNLLAGIDPSRPEEDKRMCLKAIGNTGLVMKKTTDAETDSIDHIAEIVNSNVEDVDLRVQAIYSLRRLAKVVPERIVPLLMSLVKNMDEDHQVRIAAYVIIMDTEPETDIVFSVITHLKNDKSKQVASFVYTHLESLASNYQKCKKNLYKVAKKALLTLKPFVRGAQYSKRFMWAPNFWEQKVSFNTEASVIGTPASPFPVSGSLPTTTIDPYSNQVKASGYLKFFGNELRTFTLDKDTIWSYLDGTSEWMREREDKMRVGENPYTYRKIFSLGGGVHEIPTEIGLPLQLWVDSAVAMALDAQGKAVLTPRLTDILQNPASKLERVDVEGSLTPRAAVSVMGKMKVSLDDSLMSGLYISGSLNTSAVLNGTVNVDVPKQLYQTRFNTPSSEHQAFSLRSRPYTFTYIPEPERTQTPEVARDSQESYQFTKKLIKGKLMSPRPVQNTISVGRESLGVEMELKTRRVPRSCSCTYGPTHLVFNGPIDVNVILRRGENAPENVVAYMKLEHEFKTPEEYQEFKEKFLAKQHFEVRSSSEESDEVQCTNRKSTPKPVPQEHLKSFRTMGVDFLKRFEDWKYDSARWPFTGEHVEDRSHDSTEEVIPDPAKTIELYHIYFNISTNGSQPIRELISRISLDQQDEFYKAVRFDVMTAKKTFRPDPIHLDQIKEWTEEIQTLCMQGELEHPTYGATLPESEKLEPIPGLPDVAQDPRVLFKFSTQWGKSCVEDQKMQIKARLQRSKKQQEELSEETPDKIECLKNIQETNNRYTQACKSLRREREELRAVHAELTHNELVKKTYKTFFYQGLEWITKFIWGDVKTERAEVHNPDKTVLVMGELEKTLDKLNVSVKHVRGNVRFDRLYIPRFLQDLKVLQPYKLQQHMVMSYGDDLLNGRNINQCKSLRNNSIITFDKRMYNYEQSKCDHILAKDCSSKERFVVLSRKLAQTSTKKSWDMPESASSLEIEMGSEELVHWEEFKDHVKGDIAMAPQELPPKPKTLAKIIRTKLGDSIMLFAPEQELKVFFDGHNVKVELPQKYKGLHCGLCGDFNGEVSDEFVGPNREIYKNPHRFGRSYQHTTNECAKENQCAPVMEFAYATEIILPGNKKQFACISKRPLPTCLQTCRPTEEETIDVEFVCMEHEGDSNPFPTTSTRDALINKYGNKMADYKIKMPMVTKCGRPN
ncbi:uncharacterized protein LOC110977410 [Acanthaster planci]|uniref:Uncharacterized protein LOC110977410 n=1 Tax=Acanthaster planci TaxID=133434 RepID=A0A8B7Y4E5_ACAPL|nr:uncharacterized protein LOC110977410 [Acanthaster planci]